MASLCRGLASLSQGKICCSCRTDTQCNAVQVVSRSRSILLNASPVWGVGLKFRLSSNRREGGLRSYGASWPRASSEAENEGKAVSNPDENVLGQSTFCIIEGRETVQDFARMQLEEIKHNIQGRRNRIFLLMEEVRRLRIQQRIKSAEKNALEESEEEEEIPEYPSSIPFLPPLTTDTLDQYYVTFFSLIGAIIVFGGLVAPILELRLGIGGTSYEDFIRSMHLPLQLSQVDPIVASFSGGAVGVLSALMVVEINNVKQQEHKRCTYCHGTGYLACARCSGGGVLEATSELGALQTGSSNGSMNRCLNCSGAGKVMCPTCLCTGMALATEHDPRIDPFD